MAMLAFMKVQHQKYYSPMDAEKQIAFDRSRCDYSLAPRKTPILLIPGFTQVFIGVVTLLLIKLELKDVNVPFTVAAIWVMSSGVLGLISACCSGERLIQTVINRRKQHAKTYQYSHQQISLLFLHLYQGIVLVGIIGSFGAAIHGLYVFLTGPIAGAIKPTKIPYGNHNSGHTPGPASLAFTPPETLMETSQAGRATMVASGLVCFVQTLVAIVIQKTLASRFAKYKVTEQAGSSKKREGEAATTTTRNFPEKNGEISRWALLKGVLATLLDFRVGFASVTPSSVGDVALRDTPPRYSSVALASVSVGGRRDTTQSGQSLLPTYSQVDGYTCV